MTPEEFEEFTLKLKDWDWLKHIKIDYIYNLLNVIEYHKENFCHHCTVSYLVRNIESYFWDMVKVHGISRIDLQDGLMLNYQLEVINKYT